MYVFIHSFITEIKKGQLANKRYKEITTGNSKMAARGRKQKATLL
jgi:hypothetical protein